MGKHLLLCLGFFLAIPFSVVAAEETDALWQIYAMRGDLRAFFDAETGVAIPGAGAGPLQSLEDWARQYGWQEHAELHAYGPSVPAPTPGNTPAPTLSASHYIVIDKASGAVLASERADEEWPIASITKLMTAQVAIDEGLEMEETVTIEEEDNVGGAQLWVPAGTTFSMSDLFSAMLIGSANNAAHAIAREVSSRTFVDEMNARAEDFGLEHTRFVDPTGLDPGNVSTAREVAKFADPVLSLETVRRLTTTASKKIYAISREEWRTTKNTNWLLYYPEYDDVWVTGGKTGYLEESGWNLVVRMRPSAEELNKEVVIVTFGSASKTDCFNDAEALAHWVWSSYDWQREGVQTATE